MNPPFIFLKILTYTSLIFQFFNYMLCPYSYLGRLLRVTFFTLLFSESSLDEVNVLIFGRKSKKF